MDDNYFKRKGFDDFLKKAQHVESFDDLGDILESHPKVIKPDELMGHMLMESAGAKEDDSRLLGKLRDELYKDSKVKPADIRYEKTLGPKEVAKDAIAHYDPSEKAIVMKVDANPLNKAATYAHEVGHHMDDIEGLKSIPVNEFPEEKVIAFIKNNPKATDMEVKKFMESIKNYGLEGDAAAALKAPKVRELQVTMHHEGKPRGFEMEKIYDIMKGAGKRAKQIGKGITKIGVKALGPVGIISGLASGDASAAIPGMWSEPVGEGSDEVPQLNQEEAGRFKALKERFEHEE